MTLIITPRHTRRDLEHWRLCEQEDAFAASRLSPRLDERIERALEVMRAFIAEPGGGYLGISWGKDSVICAWLLHRLAAEGVSLASCWVRVRHWENPDCALVRDAFLARWPLADYHEIEVDVGPDRHGGTSAIGFAEAARRFGDRHISGVRAEESAVRRASMGRHGIATARVCRPIGHWSTREVFALAHREGLPLHPAYGYTMGGTYDRMRLRTASLGGERGSGHGRGEWERVYYGVRLPWSQ